MKLWSLHSFLHFPHRCIQLCKSDWTKPSPKSNMCPDFFRRTGYGGFLWQLKWQGIPQPALGPMQLTDKFCICVSLWEFHVLSFPGSTWKKKPHLRHRRYNNSIPPAVRVEERALFRHWERKFLLAVDWDFRDVAYATAQDTIQNVHNNNGNQSILLWGKEEQTLGTQATCRGELEYVSECKQIPSNTNNSKLCTVYWISACVWEKGDLGREPATSWMISIFLCLSSLAW